MKFLRAESLLGFVATVLLLGLPAAAEQPGRAAHSKIEFEYVKPTQSHLIAIYERLKKREVLERLSAFLAPLRLPVVLRLTTMQCDDTNAYWEGREKGLKICYEYVDWVERLAPLEPTPEGFTREDVIIGGFVEVALHEMGHAVFDLFSIPMFGREEDAADQIAGFIMLQFGKDVALRTISGTAATYQAQAKLRQWSQTAFADTHGTDEQRFYNYLCLAYGADPATFQRFIDNKLLPAERAKNCSREYQQVRRAFNKTIMPHVDQELLQKVRSMEILKAGERR
jgi:Putative metallopeptidase